MEAMTTHSDNTATDMVLKEATPKKVRQFLAAIGAKRTLIPDSTRALAAYLFGASNYLTITWDELVAIANQSEGILANPLLNDVETFASSANDWLRSMRELSRGNFLRTGRHCRRSDGFCR